MHAHVAVPPHDEGMGMHPSNAVPPACGFDTQTVPGPHLHPLGGVGALLGQTLCAAASVELESAGPVDAHDAHTIIKPRRRAFRICVA